ncbi:MAG: DUF4349 domain-containing protein [Gemmiger sp.]
MKKKSFIRLIAALAAAALLAACGSSGGPAASSASYDMVVAESVTESEAGIMDGGGYGVPDSVLEPEQTDSSRKLVYRAELSMESTDFDAARTALLDAVKAHGGYLEYTSQSGSTEKANRWASFTARIPAQNYTAFLADAGEAGNLLYLNESAEDVTLNYIDVEARLEALKNQRDRLNALADKAETTADLLEIESQLSDVQYEIESYTRQLRALDSRIDYATVDISLDEVAVLTPTGITFGERLRDAFSGGLHAFADAVQGFVLTVVYLLPTLALLAVVLAAVLALRRAWHKKHPRRAKQLPSSVDGGSQADAAPKPKEQ